MTKRRWGGRATALLAVNVGMAWLVATVLASAGASPAAERVAGSLHRPLGIASPCPGPTCPYTPPDPIERGIAADVLARIDLERAAPARDYTYQGATTALAPLTPASPAAEATAQAAAEWQASHTTVADYTGPDPAGYRYVTGGNAAAAGDSAGIDDAVMHSYGHALGMLSAAPTEVAIGAACAKTGTLYVTEDFSDPDRATAEQGRARLAAELAGNSVYAQSGGTVTTVTDASGSGPSQDYLPQQPIVAGYGSHDAELYATGADWTCSGARHPHGAGPVSPLPAPVSAIAASRDGGYYLADRTGD